MEALDSNAKAAPGTIVVTGAFSHTGWYVTRLLLQRGFHVRTLTNHPHRENPFGGQVQVFPYNFDRPGDLTASLCGASTLINTYWVRFSYGGTTYETAVQNTLTLLRAAKEAGIQRIVHVSIANPLRDSPFAYYCGKARVEQAVRESGLSYAILRPAVIFGRGDVLINNIAWFVRRFPFFGVPGDGRYRIQPIYVEDMAELIVDAVNREDSYVLDAVGPEIFTFEELVRLIGGKVGRRVRLLHLPALLAYAATRVIGWFVGDVILTWEEYKGLMADLLVSDKPPTGRTRLSEWLSENRDAVGAHYSSELARHFRLRS